jgi:3-hydroxyacyl-CoA dehydrogenase
MVGYPFSSAYLVPLVDAVGGQTASPVAVAAAMAFYRAIGKHPIAIRKEVLGHLAKRLQAALCREALRLVAEGVASPADVDAVISEGPGMRWPLVGPHITFHLAGGGGGTDHVMAHLLPAVQRWQADLVKPVLDENL